VKDRIRYVIERGDGTYRQKKPGGLKWGDFLTAKVYQSLPQANMAVKLIGEGVAMRI
jgi:hypothetical protein